MGHEFESGIQGAWRRGGEEETARKKGKDLKTQRWVGLRQCKVIAKVVGDKVKTGNVLEREHSKNRTEHNK